MGTNLVQLANDVLTAPGDQRHGLLHQLLHTVQQTKPEALTPLENTLPELASYLYDHEATATSAITLELFRYCPINQRTVDRLVEMQRLHPNPLVVTAFGMSNPDKWDSECKAMLAEALATENTASVAAEILFNNAAVFNSSLAIEALQHLVQKAPTESHSEAISKLISHTEGTHGHQACQSLEKILHTADHAIRVEIAGKLAWTQSRGFDLLKITAADKHPEVRLASAKALSQAYRFRGKRLLAALSHDDDPQVRQFAEKVLA